MANRDAEWEQIVDAVRAILLSAKGGCTLYELNRDFRTIEGMAVPFARLGFPSLEAFIRSVPDIQMIRDGGETRAKAIPRESTLHIAEMVSKQKSAKKPNKLVPAPCRRSAVPWRPSIPSRSRRGSVYHHATPPSRAPTQSPWKVSVTVNNTRDHSQRQVLLGNGGGGDAPWDRPSTSQSTVVYCRGVVQPQPSPAASKGTPRQAAASKPTYEKPTYEKPPRLQRQVSTPSAQPAASRSAQTRLEALKNSNELQPVSPLQAAKSIIAATTDASEVHPVTSSQAVATPRSRIVSGGPAGDSCELHPVVPGRSAQARLAGLSGTSELLQAPSLQAAQTPFTVPTTTGGLYQGNSAQSRLARVQSQAMELVEVRPTVESVPFAGHNTPETNTAAHTPVQRRSSEPRSLKPTVRYEPWTDRPPTCSKPVVQDFVAQLKEYTHSKSLPLPKYKIIPRAPKGEPEVYTCKVKVLIGGEELSVGSFPEERLQPGEAAQVAAQCMLMELSKIYDTVAGETGEPSEEELLVSRIYEIVAAHPSGVWSSQVQLDYLEKYSERLPKNWLRIVSNAPYISCEHIGLHRAILTADIPEVVSRVPPPSMPVLSGLSLHKKAALGKTVPDQLVLPETKPWDVFVTCGTSVTEIWVRFIGLNHSDLYDSVSTDMEMHFMSNTAVATNPEVGGYYAIKLDDCWHRVKLLEKDTKKGEGVLAFIDHGEVETAPLGELNLMEPKFVQLPAQAMCVAMEGMDAFADDPNAPAEITEILVGRSLVGWPSDDNDSNISVRFYDTSTDEDVDLNLQMMQKLALAASPPHLPREGQICEVYVSHVSDEGAVFVQQQSRSYEYLQVLLDNLVETGLTGDRMKAASSGPLVQGQLYLTHIGEGQDWYRVRLLPGSRVQSIDYGICDDIHGQMLSLAVLSPALAMLPAQAIRVKLHGVSKWSPALSQRMRELVPAEEPVLLKVLTAGNIPVVDIVRRMGPERVLVSISMSLEMERSALEKENLPSPDIPAADKSNNEESLTENPVTVWNSVHLPKYDGLCGPDLPPIKNLLDVSVVMASNPGNFTVQPWQTVAKLEQMQKNMQNYYSTADLDEVTLDNVREGGLYAVLYEDSVWYRACVTKLIGHSMVSVYLVDFGEVGVLTLDNLRPLRSYFKELPYQAIKAKLSCVKPKHTDWSVDDCLAFQELVVGNQFVSIIVEIGPDKLNAAETVVGLRLISVAETEDVYIDQMLVDQNRAVFAERPSDDVSESPPEK